MDLLKIVSGNPSLCPKWCSFKNYSSKGKNVIVKDCVEKK
jgi:hypothetical protein